MSRNNQQLGAFPLTEINAGLASGQYFPTDMAWCEGMPNWVSLAQVPGVVVPPGAAGPPPITTAGPPMAAGPVMPVMGEQWTAGELLKIAKRQKNLLWAILAQLLMVPGVMILGSMMEGSGPGPESAVAGLLITGVFIATAILQLVMTIMLVTALKWNPVVIVLCVLALFLPCIGLLVLLIISDRATRTLKAHGLQVGLMGVPKHEIDRLQSMAPMA